MIHRWLAQSWLVVSLPLALTGSAAMYGCSSDGGASAVNDDGGSANAEAGGGTTTATAVTLGNQLDAPITTISAAQLEVFNNGDALFDTPFYPSDGIGPVFADDSCGGCHENGLRGPGVDQRMVMVEADGFTTAADQSAILYGNEVRTRLSAGATLPVVAPSIANVKVTNRNPPEILGRGYMEAVMDSEIQRVEAEQAASNGPIHGHINWVLYASDTVADPAFGQLTKGQKVIGRFGLKARIPTLDDFTADAMQNDMGITSPLRPTELPNPNHLTDDLKPGIDASLQLVGTLASYMRTTAIPTRQNLPANGPALFAAAQCSTCHVPSLKTRSDYPIAALAGIDAPVFTDFLVHDMGPALADGMVDGTATSTEYRTAPLIGVRFMKSFMNNSSAHTVQEAIAAHAGEALSSAQAFSHLSAADQQTLVEYVTAL